MAANLLVLGLAVLAVAKEEAAPPATASPRWVKQIDDFLAQDKAAPPPQGGVLFIGSSTIRLWKDLAESFPGVPVINRGFGGSTIPDAIAYADRLVLPHKPRLIVFYEGDNDLASGHSPEKVAENFKAFVELVRRDLPDVRMVFVSIKPSPRRAALLDKAREANRLVAEYVRQDPGLAYADVFTPMLGQDGQPREELFSSDRLHMSPAGYALWTEVLAPYVKK